MSKYRIVMTSAETNPQIFIKVKREGYGWHLCVWVVQVGRSMCPPVVVGSQVNTNVVVEKHNTSTGVKWVPGFINQ